MIISCIHCRSRYKVADDKYEALKKKNPECKSCGKRLFGEVKAQANLVKARKPNKDPMPEKIGIYRIEGVVGRGGMGNVYKGWDETLRRHVAIKMLSGEHGEDPEYRDRFLVEAQALAKLVHSNVTQIYSAGLENGQPYFAMELVDGQSVEDALAREKRIPAKQAIDIALQVCAGLTKARELSVIHRDIKPGNILIAKDGTAKITDFGIAKLLREDHNLTSTGMMVGTPAYTSPEQARGDKTDFRTDIYSLGATLYEMLAGKPPFEADSAMTVLMKHLNEPVRFPLYKDSPLVPPQLTGIIRKMMAKKPEGRYPNYDILIDELQAASVKFSEDNPSGESTSASGDAGAGIQSPALIDLPTDPSSTVPTFIRDAQRGSPLIFNLVLGAVLLGVGAFGYRQWIAPEPAKQTPSVGRVVAVPKSVVPPEPAGEDEPVAEYENPGVSADVSFSEERIERIGETAVRIYGSLRNFGVDTVRDVYIEAVLTDLVDEPIARRTIRSEPEAILPGEQARFSVLFKDISDVEGYEVRLVATPGVGTDQAERLE